MDCVERIGTIARQLVGNGDTDEFNRECVGSEDEAARFCPQLEANKTTDTPGDQRPHESNVRR